MIVHPAGFIIDEVCSNDEQYRRNEQPYFMLDKKLLEY